jgi:hypothetical protein
MDMSIQKRSVTMWIGTKHIAPVLAAGAVAVAIAAAPTAMADPVSALPATPVIVTAAGLGGGGGHGGGFGHGGGGFGHGGGGFGHGGGGHGYGGYDSRHAYGGWHRDRGCVNPPRCSIR